MLLALDVRNGAITIGFFEAAPPGSSAKGGWLLRRRFGAIAGRSSDEYAIILRGLAGEAAEAAADVGKGVEAGWMSSVAPSLGRELSLAVASAFGFACSVVGPGVRTGVRIRVDVPSEVGSDLICAAAAARELAGGPCIVVDFDAAIAFTAVGRGGDFLGAAIAPGLGTAAQALRGAAALLPEIALGETSAAPEKRIAAIGKTTAEAMRAGIGLGYSGLVENIVRRQREELVAAGEAESPEAVAVLCTGDEAGAALAASLNLGRFVPCLVLEGVAIIAGRAAGAARASGAAGVVV